MAAAPRWKVYSDSGEYVAACKEIEDAAAIVFFHGVTVSGGYGYSIRDGHSPKDAVWTEGREDVPDGYQGSYDYLAETVYRRVAQERNA